MLEEIPQIKQMLVELIKLQKEGKVEKKWFSVDETAYYLGYSKDKVYKLIQNEWLEGVHYHKPTGRVIINREKIDEWVMGTQVCGQRVDEIVDGLLIS
jgi:excisionase family DNA binding protein